MKTDKYRLRRLIWGLIPMSGGENRTHISVYKNTRQQEVQKMEKKYIHLIDELLKNASRDKLKIIYLFVRKIVM